MARLQILDNTIHIGGGALMSFLNFGDLNAKQLCKYLWMLCFGIYFMRNFYAGVSLYEGAPALMKLKFYSSIFYYKILDPLAILFVIKYSFELIYKFYESLNGSKTL